MGRAVATAHMAGHSLGTPWYALKAVKSAGKSADDERRWQDEKPPPEVKDLALAARDMRGWFTGRGDAAGPNRGMPEHGGRRSTGATGASGCAGFGGCLKMSWPVVTVGIV